MKVETETSKTWIKSVIKEEEILKYQSEPGVDFIPDTEIEEKLHFHRNPDPTHVREILAKSLKVKTLTPDETATLLNVTDPGLLREMSETALRVKKKVYDNRIVTFAPLYMGNFCVNDCAYCGFRNENKVMKRSILSDEEIRREIEVLAGEIGHKRLIVVYGEHPKTGIDYMTKSIETIYDVRVRTKRGKDTDGIRRVNVNAAPLSVEDLRRLKDVGIGTFQVFQETYHHATYAKIHPKNTLKGRYQWRLYAMHRAMEAGIDDVGIGALFGLYDWKFEVMGLLYHARALEKHFGVGPHTVSFPRLEPASNTPFAEASPYTVSDEDLKKIITIIRLAIPHAGMIMTAREDAPLRREAVSLGITQMDASTRIGVGSYSAGRGKQESEKQQFMLGDTRSLDELIRELAGMGYITSFCTAGYRSKRTGKCIMELLRNCQEGKFCKLNAVLTFREWLDDFASPQTHLVGERLIEREITEVKAALPKMYPVMAEYYERITRGERDLFL